MTTKRLLAVVSALALVVVIGGILAGTVLAQTETPTPDTTPKTAPFGWRGFCFGGRGGSFQSFDAIAEALGLTPTQLFEQLHSGKTLSEIAEAQGVDLAEVQKAAEAARVQAMKDAIAQAVKDGRITQEQADWLLQGLEKGYLNKGFGFGRGFMRGGGMHWHGMWGPKTNNATPVPGTTS